MNTIHLVALGQVDKEIMKSLEVGIWQIFGFELQLLPALPEPAYAYEAKRNQYSSVSILHELVKYRSNDSVRLLGVTEKDLCIPMLSFVFGHAQLQGSAAVISLARLRQEFYNLPPNQTILLNRAVKEAIHELGHTFGLLHCQDTSCAMSLSNAIHLVDSKTDELCRNCSIILEENIKNLKPLLKLEK
ncbi:MAG: archaemetzincin family Zn-dependent metalloprotease [Bacteroidota bacterium]|nr:archaemetzincin family Zn-dependent metalloprotease [Bacteroidota bacterium]